jgi:hypothetical protein
MDKAEHMLRSCWRKRRYSSSRQAHDAVRRLTQLFPGTVYAIYSCRYCGGRHLTTKH